MRWRLALVCCAAALMSATGAFAGTWNVLEYDGASRHVLPYLSSLAGGEKGTGAVRSDVFELDGDTVEFQMCGADAWPPQRGNVSWFALCDAETGLALRRAAPPGNDAMTLVRWDVVELIGRRVYFRAIDGCPETAFAWIGWRDLKVGGRPLMADLADQQMPAGWHEEERPEGEAGKTWLTLTSAADTYAFERESGTPTFGVITFNGVRQSCAPYLCSLRGGEQGMGAVRSPAFTLDTPRYEFVAMGADTPTGDAGLNLFQLVDAETLGILRQAEPPVGNELVPVSWDTRDLVGRRVIFRIVDNNDAGGWAWIGCDRVPMGGGKVAQFSDPAAIEGWHEEGQPEGAPVGGSITATTLAEMVEAEWRLEDTRRGVRWNLWEANPKAAPYLRGRLCKIMEGDFARGRLLVEEYARQGAPERELARLRGDLRELEVRYAAMLEGNADPAAWQGLRHEQRVALRALALANPLLDFERLLFVKRNTQQSYSDINVNHHAWGSRAGGDICILEGLGRNVVAGEGEPTVTALLQGRLGPGNLHGIDLNWDGRRIVFSYAQAASETPPDGWLVRQETFRLHKTVGLLHLYEIGTDGSGLRQITDGEWSDLNPCYLPGGDIAFESERMGFEINCNEMDKDEPTTNLFAMRPDGTGIRQLAVTKDGDWYPRVANDGSIMYSHWEYHERSLVYLHPLWFVRPDGTGSDNFNKQHYDYPVTLTVPRAIPGSAKIVAIGAGHHTLASGPICVVDRSVGPNDPNSVKRVTGPDVWPEYGGLAAESGVPGWRLPPGQGWYMDPWPLSETTYLASYCDGNMTDEAGYGLYLVDAYGGKELLYRDPSISSVMPIPLRPRTEPSQVASTVSAAAEATCVALDVAEGTPELAGGVVKYLRIGEPVPWRFSNELGGERYEPDAKSMGTNWTPIRILGTVPVAQDGSAQFKVPAGTELYFQALDANGMELRRMRTYVSFQPGETRSCTGCHETRPQAPPLGRAVPVALRQPAVIPNPPPWGSDRALSFLRDVQPVLDRHCVSCHSGLKPAGGVDLSPGLTQGQNRAYDTLVDPGRGLVALSSKGDNSRITPVMDVGSHRSRLVKVIQEGHAGRCELGAEDWERLYTWIDSNAVYHDTFIRKRPEGAMGYNLAEDGELWRKVGEIQARRCGSCHQDTNLARPEWLNLRAPEQSLMVAAPLAGAKRADGRAYPGMAFGDADDTDYQALLGLLEGAARKCWAEPRRDLRCFVGDAVALVPRAGE